MESHYADSHRPMTTEYDKLVRDRIPELIAADGETPTTHVANDEEYERRLVAKLREEAAEYAESGEREELADVLEVLVAILDHEGVSLEALDEVRREKRERRGGFGDRIVLERVDGADGDG